MDEYKKDRILQLIMLGVIAFGIVVIAIVLSRGSAKQTAKTTPTDNCRIEGKTLTCYNDELSSEAVTAGDMEDKL